ncbi:hypothetical protein ACQ4WX_26080 [Streptomyces lasalocidi]
MSPRFRTSRRALSAAAAAALTLTLAACGSGSSSDKGHDSGMAGTNHSTMPSPSGSGDGMASMPGMDSTSTGNGLAAAEDGYKMTATAATLPAGKATDYRFTVTGPDGKPVTDFAVDQTKRLHFYAIRSDLTGFQHVHPTMAGDGTWTAPLAALQPGTWRLYASFTPDSGASEGQGLRPQPHRAGVRHGDGLAPAEAVRHRYRRRLHGGGEGRSDGGHGAPADRHRRQGRQAGHRPPAVSRHLRPPDRLPPGRPRLRPPPPGDEGRRRPRRADPDLPRRVRPVRQLAALPPVPDRRQAAHRAPHPARRLTASSR